MTAFRSSFSIAAALAIAASLVAVDARAQSAPLPGLSRQSSAAATKALLDPADAVAADLGLPSHEEAVRQALALRARESADVDVRSALGCDREP